MRLEAPVGMQQLGIALRHVPEAEVLADRDPLGAERVDEHPVDELACALLGQLAIERHHDQLLDAETGDQLGFALERRQQPRRRLRSEHGRRVRIERHHRVGALDHAAMAEVDAVERPDREPAGTPLGDMQFDDVHPRNPTTGFSVPGATVSAIAIGPTSSTSKTGPVRHALDGTPMCEPRARHRRRAAVVGRNDAEASPSSIARSSSSGAPASVTSNGPIAVRRSCSQ